MRKIYFALVFFLAFPSPLRADDKIRVSISSVDVSFLTAGVALKRGFFKELYG